MDVIHNDLVLGGRLLDPWRVQSRCSTEVGLPRVCCASEFHPYVSDALADGQSLITYQKLYDLGAKPVKLHG